MFGLSKEDKPEDNLTSADHQTGSLPVDQAKPQEDIYVMPERFHSAGQKSSNTLLLVVAFVFVLVATSVGGYFWYNNASQNQQQAPVAQNQEPIEPALVEEPIATSTADILEATSTATSTEATTTEATSTDLLASSTQNIDLSVPPIASPDSDSDGLTDSEEIVIGTRFDNPDSDGDSYLDGAEVLAGYDPASKGKLESNPFIAKIVTNFTDDNFQTLSVKSWSYSPLPSSKQVIITLSTGEIIRISVLPNPDGLTAANWYLQKNPTVSLSQLRPITSASFSGIFSPNGLMAYLADPKGQKLYSFEYILSPGSSFRYPALFAMIVKNFQPVKTSSSPLMAPSSTPDGTGTSSSAT